jgi:hypothetical protein
MKRELKIGAETDSLNIQISIFTDLKDHHI